MLSRTEMEKVIAGRGSVLYQGRIITRAEELPSVADLAQGDPQAEGAALATLQQQMAALQAEMAKLQPAAPAEDSTEGTSPIVPVEDGTQTTPPSTKTKAPATATKGAENP